MKKTIIELMLGVGLFFTACVDQNSINVQKQMRDEQQRIYVDMFPIQNYEEYLPIGADKNNGTDKR